MQILCPKCGSQKVATDRSLDPAHTCIECMRCFDDADLKRVLGPDVEVTDGESLFPDVVGEIFGWRAWFIVETADGPRLRSLNSGHAVDHEWEPGVIQYARCPLGAHLTPKNILEADLMNFDAQVPGLYCSCGFYAASSKEHLLSMNYAKYNVDGARPKCFGQVALAGKVVQGSQGWKAQQVWAVHLYVPYEYHRFVKPLRAAYNIPVDLGNSIGKPARI